MKYAQLTYGRNKCRMASAEYVNLGDYFQTFAINNIYKKLNISNEDIQRIDKAQIREYKGETLLLPMQGWFGYIKGMDIFPMSSDIKPVFLGYHCVDRKNYRKECIENYKTFSPVGCRDQGTYCIMKKHGINAYLTGCLTITLPERKEVPQKTHVFLVDAPNGIEKYMPKELSENISYITQEIPFISKNSSDKENERVWNIAQNLLERYKTEATLVVTSRLHCAGPCLGMGIPVILARNYFDERYAWIDKYLPLYTPKDFQSIDWYPEKVDLSTIKPLLFEMVSNMIFDLPQTEQSMQKIHDFYMDRKRGNIFKPFYVQAYLGMHKTFPKTADFLREIVFNKFTVATARNKSEV